MARTAEAEAAPSSERPTTQLPFATSLSGLVFLLVNVTLLVVAIVVLALLAATAVGVGKNGDLCLSEQCINTAARVLSAMDANIDPCIDFYQYACGRWMKDNPVPDWTASWDRLAVLRETLILDMRQLLESDQVDAPGAVHKAKLLYKTCMNTDEIESKGLHPIHKALQQLGLTIEPPSVTNVTFDWLYAIAKSRRTLGINIIYGFNVAEDVRNSSLYKIVIEQISPGFGEKFLLNPNKFHHELNTFKHHIINMLSAYSPAISNQTNNTWEEFAEDIITVSTEIAKVMTPSHQRRSANHLFHEVTLDELAKGPGVEKWSIANWTRYLEIVFNNTKIVLEPQKDNAILLDLAYMQKITNLIDRIDRNKLERFIWWNVFSALAPLTIESFRLLGYDFSKRLLGLRARTPRWKGCTSSVNSNFGLALSYAYVRAHLTHADKDNVMAMLDDVRVAFDDAVQQLDWMDAVTREKTLTKLYAIRAFVGYPGWIMNATQLDKYYRKAHVTDGDLFATFLNLTDASVRRSLENMRRKPNRNRWVATATTVNAFYSATLNSVTFPAGILKPPFYGSGNQAIDYGAIGAIMGHEITHGFDDQGRRYDEHGNLKQWWSTRTLEHYHARVQCIVDQYNNYTMPELGAAFNVQGVNTQGENIADNGGLRAAYVGYQRRRMKESARVLPGLSHISDDQLFFLGFAQIWCGNSTIGALKSKLIDGVHSPNRVRVIGTLSNSLEFAAAWQCAAGAPMNPPHKCRLW